MLVSSHGGAAQLLLLMRRNHTSVQLCIHSILTMMMLVMLMRVIIINIIMDTILPKMRLTGVYLYSLHPFHFVGHVYDGGGDHHLHHHCHIFKVSPPFFVRTCCTRPPQPSQHGALGEFGFPKFRSHLLIKIIIIH